MVAVAKTTSSIAHLSIKVKPNGLDYRVNGEPVRIRDLSRIRGARVRCLELDGELTHQEVNGQLAFLGLQPAVDNVLIKGDWLL